MGRSCSQNGKRSAFKILTGAPKKKNLEGGLGVDGRTILEWILKKYVPKRGIGSILLNTGIIGEPL